MLNLRHGFHQMPIREEDRHLTAMCTPSGTVQWTVMPMGLKNAPSMLQRMMETILFQKHKALGLQDLGGSSCMFKITPNAPNLDLAKNSFSQPLFFENRI